MSSMESAPAAIPAARHAVFRPVLALPALGTPTSATYHHADAHPYQSTI
jgi:hypothetical protein